MLSCIIMSWLFYKIKKKLIIPCHLYFSGFTILPVVQQILISRSKIHIKIKIKYLVIVKINFVTSNIFETRFSKNCGKIKISSTFCIHTFSQLDTSSLNYIRLFSTTYVPTFIIFINSILSFVLIWQSLALSCSQYQ